MTSSSYRVIEGSNPTIFSVTQTNGVKKHGTQNDYKVTVYSDKISTIPTERFNQSRPNNRTGGVSQVFEKVPWNSTNSTVSSNKIKEPSIYKNTPFGDKFWKYMTISPKVSSTTVTADPTLMSQTEGTERYKGNLIKSKKRGSSNTDIEKMFRWFYTFGHSRYIFMFLLHHTLVS